MFAYVKEITGVWIDPYKTSVLYENHLKNMIAYLNAQTNMDPEMLIFKSIPEEILVTEKRLVFVGD